MRIGLAAITLLLTIGNDIKAQVRITSPDAIIYKTKKDYSNNVPVILSADRSEIVSYPDPSDIDVQTSAPARLKKGYLLDNRGINERVAFLNISYKDYAALQQAPAMSDMYAMIIDKEPLTDMCNCGPRNNYNDPVRDINKLLSRRKLKKRKCKKVKL